MCFNSFGRQSNSGTATIATSCAAGFSRSRNTSRVITPRVPSEPMKTCLRS